MQKIAQIGACENTGWEHVRLYITRYDGALRYPCSEIETGQWFPMEEVSAWIAARPEDFASGFIECWNAFDEKLQQST